MPKIASLSLVFALAAGIATAGCGGGGGSGPAPAVVSTPNAIVGTTTIGDAAPDGRVAPPPGTINLKLIELVTGLNSPWSLAFLPDRRMLITQRGGQLRLRNADGTPAASSDLVSGVPQVLFEGQGGLLDVAVDPQFASNRRIYLAFSEGTSTSNSTAVARAELNLDTRVLENVTVIFRQQPKVASSGHFGARLVFDRAGQLFVTLGDRQVESERGFAQDPTRGNGKVVRITSAGAAAPGNPANFGANAHLGLWSIGHRNPQGAALHPGSGELWVSEHGPQGGDEINRVLPGLNYGWPVISYGQEYGTTTQVGEGTVKAGMEQPVSFWETIDGTPWTGGAKSSIAPSGIAFYMADAIPQWKGNLFVGALAGTALWRLTLNGNVVRSRERLLAERGERIRDVRQGPDGWLYLLTDNGKLLRFEAG